MEAEQKRREQARRALEELVDHGSFAEVLEDLGIVAQQKAQHVLEHWQDQKTAKVWATYAKHTLKLADKLTGSQLFAEKLY